jgi:hypothetical protein
MMRLILLSIVACTGHLLAGAALFMPGGLSAPRRLA